MKKLVMKFQEPILKSDYKYNEVAERIESLICKRVLKVGDKLLSVVDFSKGY